MDALNVLILGANKYEFIDQTSQRAVKGTSVHYCQLNEDVSEERVGFFPAKVVFPYEYFDTLKGVKFPCLAQASIQLDLSNKRNPIKVTSFLIKDTVAIKM